MGRLIGKGASQKTCLKPKKYPNTPPTAKALRPDGEETIAMAGRLGGAGSSVIGHGHRCGPQIWSIAIIVMPSAVEMRKTKGDSMGHLG